MDHFGEGSTREIVPLNRVGTISRRAVVAGTVATTAVTVLPLSNTAFANTSDQDMVAFLLLSEALTGVDRETLAPEFTADASDILNSDPGIDPINVKDTYFDWIRTHAAPAPFAKLLSFAKEKPSLSQAEIISRTKASDDTKFLARSIVLLWYLGSWYEPDGPGGLKSAAASPESVAKQKVLSAKAYTQGLIWQIIGAHPMGYSNLQFGYWSRDPHDPNNPDLFTPAKS
jgi:hypothetical protein